MLEYRVKALWRWLLYVGLRRAVRYRAYGVESDTGYKGWYEIGGRVIAFRRLDGSNQFLW
jgi:hypothetical protein